MVSAPAHAFKNTRRLEFNASARVSPVDDSENALGGTPNSPDGLQEFQYHHTYLMALTAFTAVRHIATLPGRGSSLSDSIVHEQFAHRRELKMRCY